MKADMEAASAQFADAKSEKETFERSVSPSGDSVIARLWKACAVWASTKPSGAGRGRDNMDAYFNCLYPAALAFAEAQTSEGVEDVSKTVDHITWTIGPDTSRRTP